MAKRQDAKKETKSDFLRKILTKNPLVDYRDANLLWQKLGNPGEISSALFYHVRSKMGIKIEWQWVREKEPESSPATRPDQGSRAKSAQVTRPVYQLKITLKDIRPPIWRRVLVPDCPLSELHEVIQVAFGWGNCHLYNFDVADVPYTDAEGMADLDMEDAGLARLSAVVPNEKFKFNYTYDFGDYWQHDILVEEIRPPDVALQLPACIAGKRACPPDDVGGPWGYAEFVAAIQDPKHERHKELLKWSGGFEPEEFDLDIVNKELKRLG